MSKPEMQWQDQAVWSYDTVWSCVLDFLYHDGAVIPGTYDFPPLTNAQALTIVTTCDKEVKDRVNAMQMRRGESDFQRLCEQASTIDPLLQAIPPTLTLSESEHLWKNKLHQLYRVIMSIPGWKLNSGTALLYLFRPQLVPIFTGAVMEYLKRVAWIPDESWSGAMAATDAFRVDLVQNHAVFQQLQADLRVSPELDRIPNHQKQQDYCRTALTDVRLLDLLIWGYKSPSGKYQRRFRLSTTTTQGPVPAPSRKEPITMDQLGDILTVEQAADYLQVHPRTILRLLERDELKGIRIGGKLWRIRREVLLEFLDRGGTTEVSDADEGEAPSPMMQPHSSGQAARTPQALAAESPATPAPFWFVTWLKGRANAPSIYLAIPKELSDEWLKLVGIRTRQLAFDHHSRLGRGNATGPHGSGRLLSHLEALQQKFGPRHLLALEITPRPHRRTGMAQTHTNLGFLREEASMLFCPQCHRYRPLLAHGIQQRSQSISEETIAVTLPVRCAACATDYEQRLVISDLMTPVSNETSL